MKTTTLLDDLKFPESPRWREGKLWFCDYALNRVMNVDLDGRAQTVVELPDLPTAIDWTPDGRLLINPAWLDVSALHDFELLPIPPGEPWAANVALLEQTILMNSAHLRTAELLHALGFALRTTDLREFAQAEGGITCLSLLL